MSVEFTNSETMKNLMRAFAGESQARNRYTFAAKQAKEKKLYVIEAVFKFTAKQEEQHAKVFFEHLKEMAGETIHIDGGYPVDISEGIVDLLHFAVHNEYEEHDDVYKNFAKVAREEGFEAIAGSFQMIANIEKCHGDRFAKFAQLLEENKLFISDVETAWMCLNCGNIYHGTQPPKECPVCHEDRGYYIRLSLAPYTCTNMFEN